MKKRTFKHLSTATFVIMEDGCIEYRVQIEGADIRMLPELAKDIAEKTNLQSKTIQCTAAFLKNNEPQSVRQCIKIGKKWKSANIRVDQESPFQKKSITNGTIFIREKDLPSQIEKFLSNFLTAANERARNTDGPVFILKAEEILSRTIAVHGAKSIDEAIEAVEDKMNCDDILLTDDDLKTRNVTEADPDTYDKAHVCHINI